MRTRRVVIAAALMVLVVVAAGVTVRVIRHGRQQSTVSSALHAREVVLTREIEGLQSAVARLERHEFILPPGDIAVAVDDQLVQDLISAQLPLTADVQQFQLTLSAADVQFRGSPVVRLTGALHVRERPALGANVRVIGSLTDVEVDSAGGVLVATVSVDHLDIEDTVGLQAFVTGDTRDALSKRLRLEVAGRLPVLRVPVKIQPDLPLPAVTRGPVRLPAARLPIKMSVSSVIAAAGTLWIGVHAEAGAVVRVTAPGGR